MYKEARFPARVIIIKTSSLGDIIQAFCVLDTLHTHLPQVQVDWAVDERFYSLVAAHPLVSRAIPLHFRENRRYFKDLKELRKQNYDLLIDLQGNCKSALVTFLSRAKLKVGYGIKSVREWPNVLATHLRFEVSKEKRIGDFYLELVERALQIEKKKYDVLGVKFQISKEEEKKNKELIFSITQRKIMVCPGSKWVNKQLDVSTWISFLQKIEAHFFLVWGNEKEKIACEMIKKELPHASLVDLQSLASLQNLMAEMDLVMAVDSSALHLCATTSTPSFSIFGPTSKEVFKPSGERHFALQGSCPYNETFVKQCPRLRSCKTGACMKIKSEELFQFYQSQCGSRPL